MVAITTGSLYQVRSRAPAWRCGCGPATGRGATGRWATERGATGGWALGTIRGGIGGGRVARGGLAGPAVAGAAGLDGGETGGESAGEMGGETGGASAGETGCVDTGRGTPETAPPRPTAAPMHRAPSTTTVSGCSRVVGATPSSVWIRWAASGIRLEPPTRWMSALEVRESISFAPRTSS